MWRREGLWNRGRSWYVFIGLMCGLGMALPVAAQAPTGKRELRNQVLKDAMTYCLPCHAMPTLPEAVSAGNLGPPLIAMSARFPDKQALRARVWDAVTSQPDTAMPSFGKHKVLTEAQLDQLVDFIYGL